MTKPLVYLAGPYTHPDPVTNVHRILQVADKLVYDGIVTPIVPHLTMLWDLVISHDIQWWYDYDMEVLAHCTALLRIPGISTGADEEERFARSNGIPIYQIGRWDYLDVPETAFPPFYEWMNHIASKS